MKKAFSALFSWLRSFVRALFYWPSKKKIKYIYDKENRISIYHGMNVSNFAKHASDKPGYFDRGTASVSWHTQKDYRRMNEWGFNLMRYLVFWEAIEPEDGTYDEYYMKMTIGRIKTAGQYGIDVVVDLHQDLFAQKFTGNGFPEWVINDDGEKFTPRTPWNLNYLEPAVIASYTNFWKDRDAQAKYVNMLEYVLKQVDNLDNVIGLDIMNEPFPGMTIGFEGNELTNFYNSVMLMVKRNGFKTRIFFEPWMSTSTGIPTSLTFKPTDNCAFFPHYYDAFCHEGKPYKSLNRNLMKRAVKIKVTEAQKFGVPILFGEFGISPTVQNYLQNLNDFLALMDEYNTGWTYWSYDKTIHSGYGIIDENLVEQQNMTELVHVYPQKIAGTNPKYKRKNNKFTLEYATAETSAPTEIFIPKKCESVVILINGQIVDPTTNNSIFTYNNDKVKKQKIEISWV